MSAEIRRKKNTTGGKNAQVDNFAIQHLPVYIDGFFSIHSTGFIYAHICRRPTQPNSAVPVPREHSRTPSSNAFKNRI